MQNQVVMAFVLIIATGCLGPMTFSADDRSAAPSQSNATVSDTVTGTWSAMPSKTVTDDQKKSRACAISRSLPAQLVSELS